MAIGTKVGASSQTSWRSFLATDLGGGVLLAIAAVLAMIVANSPLNSAYDALFDTRLTIKLGAIGLDKPLLLWINDGLMAVFFCLVGLEIRKELATGSLANPRAAALPAIAALGGMAVPALVYCLALSAKGVPLTDVAWRGWAIPAATDIAFAVAVLALAGPRVPPALKVFLLALAIIDDLGAIVIIALFYTAELGTPALVTAAIAVSALVALRRTGVTRLAPYVVIGIALWVAVLKSGVHATLAGVVLAMALPSGNANSPDESLAERVEHGLVPWVRYAVLPLFAFANAGVALTGFTFGVLMQPIPLAIMLGLIVGKPVGVVAASVLAMRLGIAERPPGLTTRHFIGVGCLAGIGFTMSLFIGMLAFPEAEAGLALRTGVLAGSIISAILGLMILRQGASSTPR